MLEDERLGIVQLDDLARRAEQFEHLGLGRGADLDLGHHLRPPVGIVLVLLEVTAGREQEHGQNQQDLLHDTGITRCVSLAKQATYSPPVIFWSISD